MVPNILVPGTGFIEGNFPMDRKEWGMVSG